MTSKMTTGSVLFFSLIAGLFSLSVLSWADDSDGSPQWCANAKTKVEKLICEDGELLQFDQELGAYYETLLSMVGPSTKSKLVQSQKKWIAGRERCGATAKTTEDLVSCVDAKIHQRRDLLRKDVQERNIEERLSEFAKFKLKTFKGTGFEFRYPSSWDLETTEDGRISLKSKPEEMSLGFDKTVTSSKKCPTRRKEPPKKRFEGFSMKGRSG